MVMIKIRDNDFNLLAILDKVLSANVIEEINREYTADFTINRDDSKAEYISQSNVVDINDDYFYINKYTKTMSDGADVIDVECEHISYLLNDDTVEYFGHSGTPSFILGKILEGTILTVGTMDFTDNIVFGIEEEVTKRQLLTLFAQTLGGELVFDGLSVGIVQERGTDDGKQFRVGKNISGVNYEVEESKVAFEIDVVELGDTDLEQIRLGDTRRVIVPHLDINEYTRVVRYEYNPIKKQNSTVELANFIEDLSDDLVTIRSESIQKDTLYNGIRVGPINGFEATRSDELVRTRMNATEGFKLQTRDTDTSDWIDRFFINESGELRLNTQQTDDIGSQFEVLENEINLRVTNQTFNNEINILEDQINLKVSETDYTGAEIASRINLAPGTVTIEAEKINFVGSVFGQDATFTGDLSAVGGTFTGDLSAVGGTFSGSISTGGTGLLLSGSPDRAIIRFDGAGPVLSHVFDGGLKLDATRFFMNGNVYNSSSSTADSLKFYTRGENDSRYSYSGHNHGGSTANAGFHSHGGATGTSGVHDHNLTVGHQVRMRNPSTGTEYWSSNFSNAPAHTHAIESQSSHSHNIQGD